MTGHRALDAVTARLTIAAEPVSAPSRPEMRDLAITGALVALSVAEGFAYGSLDTTVSAVIVCLPLPWRRVAPAHTAIACAVLLLAVTLPVPQIHDFAFAGVAVAFGMFAVATHAPREQIVPVSLVVLALVLVSVAIPLKPADAGALVFIPWLVLGLPLVAGLAIRSQEGLQERLAAQANALRAARADRAARAAEAERARIAADLHHLVAAALDAMLDEVADARRRGRAAPQAAAPSIERIEDRGRATLDEMRRLLGVLRRGDEDLALTPQPSLQRLDALAERLAHRGVQLTIDAPDDGNALAPGVDVAAFRLVEETLEAATAATRASVRVRRHRMGLELVIATDDERLSDPGRLAGPRARVALFDGALDVRLAAGGGTEVRVTLRAGRAGA